MSKKRKYRCTAAEQAIHEEAVRLRKMTDKQLVEEFHRATEQEIAPSLPGMAQNNRNGVEPNKNTSDVQMLLNALSEGKCKGVKGATVYKITEFATEMGMI